MDVHDADPEDGFVSWEVDPTLAYDREATFEEAMRLHAWLDRRRGRAPVAIGVAGGRANAHGRPSRALTARPRATFASAS